MLALEEKLLAIGCPKINLMFRDNAKVEKFYSSYKRDEVIEMGKRLIQDWKM